jgi:hypothetical protein
MSCAVEIVQGRFTSNALTCYYSSLQTKIVIVVPFYAAPCCRISPILSRSSRYPTKGLNIAVKIRHHPMKTNEKVIGLDSRDSSSAQPFDTADDDLAQRCSTQKSDVQSHVQNTIVLRCLPPYPPLSASA